MVAIRYLATPSTPPVAKLPAGWKLRYSNGQPLLMPAGEQHDIIDLSASQSGDEDPKKTLEE